MSETATHHHHHQEEHFEQTETVRDIVIGMADGLTVPFALAAGLSSAVSSNAIIITAGFAEIVAGSIAMGLGGYLAGKTEIEHYDSELAREYREIKHITKRKEERWKKFLPITDCRRNLRRQSWMKWKKIRING